MEPFKLNLSKEEAIELSTKISRGKAIGTDSFPDDVLTREQL